MARNKPVDDKWMVVYRSTDTATCFETSERKEAMKTARIFRQYDEGTVEVFERRRFWDLNDQD